MSTSLKAFAMLQAESVCDAPSRRVGHADVGLLGNARTSGLGRARRKCSLLVGTSLHGSSRLDTDVVGVV
eukprot:6177632-Pleurochrysis_carterae.AAC.2